MPPHRNLWKRAVRLVVLAASAISLGCASAPPPRRAEVRPPAPSPDAVWVAGHWEWMGRKAGYQWVPGRWEARALGALRGAEPEEPR